MFWNPAVLPLTDNLRRRKGGAVVASQSAIAVVTEGLRRRLTEAICTDFPAVQVVARRPEVNDGQSQSQVSIYLYRVSEGPQLRNRPQKDSDDGPAATLDLHYLLSFTGDEDDLVPQRMLDLAVTSLHTSPVLRSAEVEVAGVERFRADSGLKDEVAQVRLTMSSLSLEELSKIWSVLVQGPLQLSVGYKAGVVLIDSEPTTRASPVQARDVDELPISSPVVEQRLVRETWLDDVQLPDDQKCILVQIRDQVLLRDTVYDNYGFRQRLPGYLGVTALFVGESGTGKTMAAQALAKQLHLDLYRIDLGTLVSTYIGETEKNLKRVFDVAEESSAVLLFDEADAIFGKRSEVQDSHVRYANVEVSYLLQRMEAYSGLAILTTNRKSAVDSAFLRRLRFIVTFPFPGAEQRLSIWKGIFPRAGADPSAKGLEGLDSLDFEALATPPFTGGQIRSIAVNGAFLAAAGDGVLSMDLLHVAARDELRKMGRTYTASDFSAWITPGSDA